MRPLAPLSAEVSLRQFAISMYLSSVLPTVRYARLRLPCSGSLGPRFPTFSVIFDLRYYALLRLPVVLLESLRSSLSLPNTHAPLSLFFVSRSHGSLTVPKVWLVSARSLDPPVLLVFWLLGWETTGSLEFPSYPCSTCPALRPRWCPVNSPCFRSPDCCLPAHKDRRLSHARFSVWLSLRPPAYPFRGSITRPVSLLLPAPYSCYQVCMWVSLPTCWLGFDRVGFVSS